MDIQKTFHKKMLPIAINGLSHLLFAINRKYVLENLLRIHLHN